MPTLIALLLLAGSLQAADASASERPRRFGLEFHTETLSEDLQFLTTVTSPSGRYVAWREGTGIKLYDGYRGTTTDLPGPALHPTAGSSRENLQVSDTHVAWRRVTAGIFDLTELYLYDIRAETLTEVYAPSTVNDPPVFLLPDALVWEGIVETEPDVRFRHILVYRIRSRELIDLTPGNASAGWLAGDGPRLAWAGDSIQVPGQGTHYTTVRTYDLRTGRADLLDEAPINHFDVRVSSDTVVWQADEGTIVLRSATLRPGCSDRFGLAVVPGLWLLRRRRGRR